MLGRCDGMAVLVLTGRNEIEVRVRCLNLGADDCMLKPFSFYELRARCRALLRRREQFADLILRYGGVELNRMQRGTITDSALELSNVDISTEFADLKVAQRAFEANSKTVPTFDTVTQDTTL